MNTYTLSLRMKIEVNTDPQRRCYNGCHATSELQWSDWEVLDSFLTEAKKQCALFFWRELNDYAISQRGESARAEFKIEPSKA